MLTELQRRVARLMSGLVEAESFALAGGAALIVHGVVERATRDLDYFATASEAVADVLPILEGTLRRDGLAVVRRRDAPGFARLEITDEAGQVIEVDLAYDARLLPAQASQLGPVLHPDELAADKVLALYGRAEGRDFHDVAALARGYPTERLLELAAAKDRGFDRRRFTETLAAIGRLRDADFPDAACRGAPEVVRAVAKGAGQRTVGASSRLGAPGWPRIDPWTLLTARTNGERVRHVAADRVRSPWIRGGPQPARARCHRSVHPGRRHLTMPRRGTTG